MTDNPDERLPFIQNECKIPFSEFRPSERPYDPEERSSRFSEKLRYNSPVILAIKRHRAKSSYACNWHGAPFKFDSLGIAVRSDNSFSHEADADLLGIISGGAICVDVNIA